MRQVCNKTATLSFSAFLLFFLFSSSANAQNRTDQERVYIKIEIKGMACPYCAFGMEKELKKVAGVDNVDIELKKGMAYISTPASQRPIKKNLESIITNAGFTVGEIEFSDKPIITKKEKEK